MTAVCYKSHELHARKKLSTFGKALMHEYEKRYCEPRLSRSFTSSFFDPQYEGWERRQFWCWIGDGVNAMKVIPDPKSIHAMLICTVAPQNRRRAFIDVVARGVAAAPGSARKLLDHVHQALASEGYDEVLLPPGLPRDGLAVLHRRART
jgi:hypothetical protein